MGRVISLDLLVRVGREELRDHHGELFIVVQLVPARRFKLFGEMCCDNEKLLYEVAPK